MTNMANTLPIVPPEIVRIVASYMDRDVVLTLGMTNRFCAGLFAGIYYHDWRVVCCRGSNGKVETNSTGKYYTTNLESFFQGLKKGFAPAYAKNVHFHFCKHPQPDYDAESCSKRILQTNWPLDQTGEFLKLFNASEIVVTIRNSHQLGYICYEPFLRALLSESLCALPNAVVKFRVYNREEAPGLDPGSLYCTIRDSSTSQAAAADNLQRALSQIRPSSIDYDLWDGYEHFKICPARQIVGIYPNVRCLRLSRYDANQDNISGQQRRDYVAKPEEYLAAFPQCQRLICQWKNFGYYGHILTTFCFDNVSAQERQCTKILVHFELYTWVYELYLHTVVSKHVKVLEFHQTQHNMLARRWLANTPATLNVLLACLLWSFPNLERMVVKFGAGMIMDGPNHLGTLSKGFCERCELSVDVLEFDIRTLVREGRLSAVNPYSAFTTLKTQISARGLGV